MDPSCLSPTGWAAPVPLDVTSEKTREERVGGSQVRAPEAIPPWARAWIDIPDLNYLAASTNSHLKKQKKAFKDSA